MSSPTISILLPCLNARPFLEPRIESLIRQTYSNWEAIVLDSGSTDGSWEFFQSIAANDFRFQLHQVPREGVYAALNQGMRIATGEFLHFAPCDDTMAPEFLASMLDAFSKCPGVDLAACDALFINQNGDKLSSEDLKEHLSPGSIRTLLRSDTVRTAVPGEEKQKMNYRPAPHDCVLHYTGRSVYYSLTQLLIRTVAAKKIGLFETNVGSVADFGWLLRLTNLTGTVHLPQKLAGWRFHGEQLSIYRDESRRVSVSLMCKNLLPEISQRHQLTLTPADCGLLLLESKIIAERSVVTNIRLWLEGIARLFRAFVQRPAAIGKVLLSIGWRLANLRECIPALILQTRGVAAREL